MKRFLIALSVLAVCDSKGNDAAVKVPDSKPAGIEHAPKEERKEIKVDVQKDPLAYKVHQLPAGTIATFEGWKINILPSDPNWATMETHPDGKENDFQMIVSAGTPEARIQANLFEEGARFLEQRIPAMRPKGEAKACTFGGDEARVR